MTSESEPTTVYIRGEAFELRPGDVVVCPVEWRFPFLRLVLTLRVSLVDDRVVRLDSRRAIRKRRSWQVLRAARAGEA